MNTIMDATTNEPLGQHFGDDQLYIIVDRLLFNHRNENELSVTDLQGRTHVLRGARFTTGPLANTRLTLCNLWQVYQPGTPVAVSMDAATRRAVERDLERRFRDGSFDGFHHLCHDFGEDGVAVVANIQLPAIRLLERVNAPSVEHEERGAWKPVSKALATMVDDAQGYGVGRIVFHIVTPLTLTTYELEIPKKPDCACVQRNMRTGFERDVRIVPSNRIVPSSCIPFPSSMSAERRDELKRAAPDCLKCPVSLELLDDPVMVTTTGHTYNASTVAQLPYINGKRRCPNTRKDFSEVVPNYKLRAVIEAYIGGTLVVAPPTD